jgi:hypothetical protein
VSENPYAAPETENPQGEGVISVEEMRRAHLSNETAIKTIGVLYMIGGVLFGYIASISFSLGEGGVAFLIFVMASFLIWTGWNLSQLAPFAQSAGIGFAVLGLFWFPVGTIVGSYFLYQLCRKKAGRVLSSEYHEIVDQTPHLKTKTSKIIWTTVLILLLILGGIVVWVLAKKLIIS